MSRYQLSRSSAHRETGTEKQTLATFRSYRNSLRVLQETLGRETQLAYNMPMLLTVYIICVLVSRNFYYTRNIKYIILEAVIVM